MVRIVTVLFLITVITLLCTGCPPGRSYVYEYEQIFNSNYIANSVWKTREGGYILAGYTSALGQGKGDIYIIKTDSQGRQEWSRTHGSSDYDEANSVRQTSDGGYIVAGSYGGWGRGNGDACFIKTGPNGNEEWSKILHFVDDNNYSVDSRFEVVEQTDDGGFIVAGSIGEAIKNACDIFLIKTGAGGEEEWRRIIESPNRFEYPVSIQQTMDGGIVIAGYSGRGQWGGDVLLVKLDYSGAPEWERTYGGSKHEEASVVLETNDEGYIIAGYTESYGNKGDIYLVKTDNLGKKEWAKSYGGMEKDKAYWVQQTNDNRFIVTGATDSFGDNKDDFYMVKTDSAGVEEWVKVFKITYWERINSVRNTHDGGYIITGETDSYGDDGTNIYLIKIDDDANQEWSTTFGGLDWEPGYSIWQTSNGGYIITGYTLSSGAGGSDVYLTKIDASGVMEWRRTFGGPKLDRARSVQQTTDGGYVIVGRTTSFGSGEDDVLLIKADADGNEAWIKTFGGSDSDQAFSIQQTRDGGYIIAGSSSSYGENMDIYVIKTDEDGVEEWSSTYGGSSVDRARSVQQTDDDGYIIAGYTFPDKENYSDAYLIKVDTNGGEEWSRTFGISSVDEAAFSVAQTADGGYVVAGFTEQLGDRDIYLLITDANGKEKWTKTFGGLGQDEAYSVQQTSDGGYVLAGSTPALGRGPLYVLKTDAKGNEEWGGYFGDHSKGGAESIQQTRDGGYVVSGFTFRTYVIKIDMNGNEEWSQRY